MTTSGVRRAVVPAAGKGTRMAAIRGDGPKELVPVADVPMLLYAITDLLLAGIEEICVVLAPGKAEIQRLLAKRFEERKPEESCSAWWSALSRVQFHFPIQEEPLGLAHAVGCAAELLGDEPFVLHLPDNIFRGERPATSEVLDAFHQTRASTVALSRVTPETAGGFGNCGRIVTDDVDPATVGIREVGDKGTGAFAADGVGWRTCGLGVFTKEFLEINRTLKANAKGEWDDVPIIQRLASVGRLYGRKLAATCYDVGNPAGYERAQGEVTGLPVAPAA